MPRSKTSKVELVTCSICQCIFSSKDQDIHVNICKETVNIDILDIPHGLIKSEELYGQVILVEGIDHLPSICRNNIIYVHPSAMKICGFYIGCPVVINKDKASYVWPGPRQPLTAIGMTADVQQKLNIAEIALVTSMSKTAAAGHTSWISKDHKPFVETDNFRDYFKHIHIDQFFTIGNIVSFLYYGQPCELTLTDVNELKPKRRSKATSVEETFQNMTLSENHAEVVKMFYRITSQTKINVKVKNKSFKMKRKKIPSINDLGGLDSQVSMLQELVELQLKSPEKKQGVDIPRGILLYGPSGTGKSILAQAIAHASGVFVVSVNGSDIWSRYYGESEERLRNIFKEAQDNSPSVILIDEIDTLCPRRVASHSELEKRVVTALLTTLDDVLSSDEAVMVIAATNKRDNLDPSLRRPGRLDREVEIGVPTATQRADILKKVLAKVQSTLSVDDITWIANQAHGFVGADLSAVVKEASMYALRRCGRNPLIITVEDIKYGLGQVQPSAMREVSLEVPQVTWSDIGGQKELKQKLKQAIEWPLKHPEAFIRLGIKPPRGLLMYGPPGCSKTMIAKALARESGLNFISIKGPELFGKYVGESESAVREVFRKARSAAPAIIFFDEIDALAGERGSGSGGSDVADRVLAQILTEMDGVEILKDVTIVAATNRPDRIDKALLRPGRLDRIVYVPLPDPDTRQEIFKIHFRKTPVGKDVIIDELVKKTHGYSGAEVTAVCHEAALGAMQEDINISCVFARHFQLALDSVKPRTTKDRIDFYEQYHQSAGLYSL